MTGKTRSDLAECLILILMRIVSEAWCQDQTLDVTPADKGEHLVF